MSGDPAKAYSYRSLGLLVAIDVASHLHSYAYVAGFLIPYQANMVKRIQL